MIRRPSRPRSRAAAVLAAAVSLIALTSQASFAAPPTGPTAAAASVRAYLVLTSPGSVDAVTPAITANGGQVRASYNTIGVILAHSGASDFATRMRRVTGVQKVGDTRGGYDVPTPGTLAATTGRDSAARRVLERELGAAIAAPAEPVDWNMQQMGADQAWAINPGSRSVTVGILDTGVQGTHEDLRDNFDSANSVSCLYGRPNTAPGAWEPDNGAPAAGHGTSVAGIIAAAKNGKGVVGVAPNVKIASVKVMEPEGYMYPENVVCGLMWSADHGFRVTNHSYYVDPVTFNDPNNLDQAAVIEGVERAVDYAKGKGSVTVAAAGNYATNLDTEPGLFLPGDLPNVISVTADTVDKKLASYSNYGLNTVEVTAPGGEGSAMINTTAMGGGYTTFNGTSASSPHAAGVMALLASANPQATVDQLRALLLKQAIDTPCPSGDSRCTGTAARNSHFGEGITNALAAVSGGTSGDTQAPTVPASVRAPSVTATGVSLEWNASTDNVGVTGYQVFNGTTLAATVATTAATVSGLAPSTSYTFSVKAVDAAGNVSAASSPLTVTTKPGGSETTVYSSDFESGGWTVNANGTDTATSGRFEVAAPLATSYNSLIMQRGNTTSGTRALVTGAAAGGSVGDNDLDGGVTSALSAQITLPTDGRLTLSLSWYLGHLANSAGADYLRVRAITSDGSTVLFEKKTGSSDTAAQWTTATVDLTSLAGKTIRISVEAADVAGGSLVEAGVDDVRVTRRTP
ncbi:S8 family serine peptidase [Longispora sp. NPDC051575]|uniref:S8 family serine peptidase n=1 Tax=Longispora sp. NPDC051575 TaxID=3154943 RepID=UPI00341E7E72